MTFSLFRKSAEAQQRDLESVLRSCPETDDFLQTVQWLEQVLEWIRSDSRFRDEITLERRRLPVARIKYILRYLNKDEALRQKVSARLRFLFNQIRALEIFSDIGLSQGRGFFQEFNSRLFEAVFLEPPIEKNLATLFLRLFTESEDASWISEIDETVFKDLADLLKTPDGSDGVDWSKFKREALTSLVLLSSQVQASALHPLVRSRLGYDDPTHTGFFRLNEQVMECFHTSLKSQESAKRVREVQKLIIDCKIELSRVYDHLRENGVSVGVVYQVEKIYLELERMEGLLALLESDHPDPRKVRALISHLIFGIHQQSRLLPFLQQNLQMIIRRVIERNSQIGEHYITRTPREYAKMFKSAAGGGFITAFTVFLKYLILALPFAQLAIGLIATLNFSVSFILIQMFGFTLATKQPASTAPLLASQLKAARRSGFDSVLDELQNTVRSQFAAVMANMTAVIPTALIICFLFEFVMGRFPLGHDSAHHIAESTDILGPSFIYASFTGFLLFASSLFAGWADNWFVLHKVKDRMRSNEKLTHLVGAKNIVRFGDYIQENASSLGASISLGFMLGMVPELLKFSGIPLEVRHVTLSSGSLAAAIPTLGFEFLTTEAFWRAFLGILVIGFLNVAVSFSLAFGFALYATKTRDQERESIFKLLVVKFFKEPLSFFFPIGSKASPSEHSKRH